jgi:hypothetical protein
VSNLFKTVLDKVSLWIMCLPCLDKPIQYLAYQRKRAFRRRTEARLRNWGLFPDVVQSGPFAGMKYPPGSKFWISCRFEKVIGCYEWELHSSLECLLQEKSYTSVINAGAAEGSYAVGLGLRSPQARVYAFEASAERRADIQELAQLNGIAGRLAVLEWCDPAALRKIDPGKTPLVVCDVDGYEEVLMDPEQVPWLRHADIVLEVHEFLGRALSEKERAAFERKHDFLRRDMGDIIRARFSSTHHIEEYFVSSVPYEKFPVLLNLTMPEIQAMTDSDRACIHPWFVMKAN